MMWVKSGFWGNEEDVEHGVSDVVGLILMAPLTVVIVREDDGRYIVLFSKREKEDKKMTYLDISNI